MAELYQEAARCVQRANLKEGSLKTLVYSSNYKNLRQLFLLVSESIKYQTILKDILKRCGTSLLNEELVNNDQDMAIVLVYELLVGNNFGHNGSIRKVMRKYQAEIKSAKREFLDENKATSLMQVLKRETGEKKAIPRYARVNLIKGTVQDAVDRLCEDGWEYVGKLNIDRFEEDVASLGEGQFGLDPLLEDVVVFPANTDLHNDTLVTEGVIVLQDRASCIPAHVLNPQTDSVVLDCCAAPGNKTSHLASLMKDQGRIIALDRDAKRMATMKTLLQRYGSSSVDAITQDFLTLSPHSEEVQDINMILVDPSCSGSGMLGSTARNASLQRLETLKRFQISLLKHALRFPNVQRVVYSTCSIHQKENEEVVEEVMESVGRFFQFVSVLPEWPSSRGLDSFKNHKHFLRVSSEKHLTTGFFVACFERIKQNVKDCENHKIEDDRVNGREDEDSECLDINLNGDDHKIHCNDKTEDLANELDDNQTLQSSKKKKIKHQSEHISENSCTESDIRDITNMGHSDTVDSLNHTNGSQEETPKLGEGEKKKKKKKHSREKNESCIENFEDTFDSGDHSEHKSKAKKRKRMDIDEDATGQQANSEEGGVSSKKKKLKDKELKDIDMEEDTSSNKHKKKKSKKEKERSVLECDDQQFDDGEDSAVDVSKKKKKKAKKAKERSVSECDGKQLDSGDNENGAVDVSKKKKFKKETEKSVSDSDGEQKQFDDDNDVGTMNVIKKKRKKVKKEKERSVSDCDGKQFDDDGENEDGALNVSKKKKAKKHKNKKELQ